MAGGLWTIATHEKPRIVRHDGRWVIRFSKYVNQDLGWEAARWCDRMNMKGKTNEKR